MKTIYLSGPINGMKNKNREDFNRAKSYYEALGYNVINPHEIGDALILVNDELGEKKPSEIDFIGEDIKALSECDAIILLPGWQNSKGARFEVAFAAAYGLQIFESYNDYEIKIIGQFHFEKITTNNELIVQPLDLLV